jgi:hypothetical protein
MTDVNVPTVINKQKKLGEKLVFVESGKLMKKEQDPGPDPYPVVRYRNPDPDSYQNVTEPQHWFNTEDIVPDEEPYLFE